MTVARRVPLTPAELGVLVCLADGLTQAEIAEERQVALDTVHRQVKSLRAKLDAKTTPHAVALAYHLGLLVPMEHAA